MGLALDLLDGFLIGRYEEKRESFDLLRSDTIFHGKISPVLEPFQNKDSSLVLLLLGTVK